jgi:hypothetical protein
MIYEIDAFWLGIAWLTPLMLTITLSFMALVHMIWLKIKECSKLDILGGLIILFVMSTAVVGMKILIDVRNAQIVAERIDER